MFTRLTAICIYACCACLFVPSAQAETIAFTATYHYIFNQLETEDQARVIALAKTRQAIYTAAGPTIQKTQSYKNALPVENLSHTLASGVMSFETHTLTLKKITQGHEVSLKLIGRLDADGLEKNLRDFIGNRFLFDNALAGRKREGALLEALDTLKETYQNARQRNGEKLKASEIERQTAKRRQLVNRLAAIAMNDAIITAALKKDFLDPGEAIKRLNRAVTLDDRNEWLYLHRGRVFHRLKDRISAAADFERALTLDPYLIFCYEFQGDVQFDAGETRAAIQSFSKAIALDMIYAPTFMKRGRAYRQMNQYYPAVKDFTRVIEIDPSLAVGYLERGEVRYASGEYAEAAVDFGRVVALNPEDGAVYAKRGRAWMAAGLPDRACDDLKQACLLGACDGLRAATTEGACLSLDSASAGKWSQTCYEQVLEGRWHQAIQSATLAIYHDPDAVNPYINRSWAYVETGALEKALQDADKALSMAPKNALALNNRGLVYERKGDMGKAATAYFKACELGLEIGCKNYLAAKKPQPKEVSPVDRLLRQSAEKYRDKNWEAVVRLTSLVILKDPQSDRAYTVRAAALSQAGRLQEAISDCNAAIQINPSYGLAYNNRGYALERMEKKREEALVDYRVGCLLGVDLACQNYTRLEALIR